MPDDPLAVPAPGAADPTAAAARGDATGDPDGGGRDPYAWEADLYDVTTTGVSEQDVPFYTALAADAGGPVLELGCGTGRVLAPCAAAAGGGVGVDSSPAMLERARRRLAAAGLADRVELHLGDMRTVRLGRRFPLVTIPFRSMFHLPGDDEWLAALATVRAHLGPGGRFAGDVFVPDPEVLTSRNDHHGFAGEVRHPDTGQRMALWEHNSFDPVAQVAHKRRVTEILDDDGLVLERRHCLLDVHFRHPNEVLRLLAAAGLTVEQVLVGLCQVGAGGDPVRHSHRGAGRWHTGQAPAQQASRTCSCSSSCHKLRPTPLVLGDAAAPGSKSHARPRPA
jgi:SAM-dependent methyltransferase